MPSIIGSDVIFCFVVFVSFYLLEMTICIFAQRGLFCRNTGFTFQHIRSNCHCLKRIDSTSGSRPPHFSVANLRLRSGYIFYDFCIWFHFFSEKFINNLLIFSVQILYKHKKGAHVKDHLNCNLPFGEKDLSQKLHFTAYMKINFSANDLFSRSNILQHCLQFSVSLSQKKTVLILYQIKLFTLFPFFPSNNW